MPLDGELLERDDPAALRALPIPAVLMGNPFTVKRVEINILAGSTVADIVAGCGLSARAQTLVSVFIGEMEVSPEHWHRVRPKPGWQIFIRVRLGKGGKDILRTVLLLAVVIVAFWAAGAIVTALGVTGLIATAVFVVSFAAIATVGQYLVNALIPPPGNRYSFDQQLGNPYAQLTGLRNQAAPYGPIPRVMGTRRMFPMLAARPYTETIGNDQYLRMLLLVGYGPVAITSIKLGETDISSFAGAEVEVREGWYGVAGHGDDTPVTLYTRDIREEGFSVLFDSASDTITKTTHANCVEISLDLSAPGGLFNADDKGQLQQVEIDFTIEYRVVGSVGAWTNAAWIDGDSDLGTGTHGTLKCIDKTANGVRRSGRWTVASGQYDVRVTRTTAAIGARASDKIYLTALRSVVSGTPLPMNGLSLIAIRLKATEQLNGVPDQINCVAQSYLPVWDGAAWDYQLTNNPAWAFTDVLRRRGQSVIMADSRVDLDTMTDWAAACDAAASTNSNLFPRSEPTVAQLGATANTSDTTVASAPFETLNWLDIANSAGTAFAYETVTTTAAAHNISVYVEADSIPTVDQSHTNPAGDFTFTIHGSDNALTDVLYEQVSSRVWRVSATMASVGAGAGNCGVARHTTQNTRPMKFSRLQLSLARLQPYVLTTGTAATGDEHTWEFNAVLEGGSIFSALRTIAAHGRAAFTVRDGKYSVVRDVAQTVPVQLFTPRNSWGYQGQKVFVDVPHCLRVRFTNADKLYAPDEVRVYQDGYNADGSGGNTAATKFDTLEMPGITSDRQAWREGRYHLAVLLLRAETHAITTDIENLRCTLGDLVLLTHDVVSIGIASGRLASVDGSVVTVDNPASLAYSENYFTYSEDLAHGASWGLANATVVSNVASNPLDNAVTADKLAEDGANATHYTGHAIITGFTTGETVTTSAYLCADERSVVRFLLNDNAGNYHGPIVDLLAGTILSTDVSGTGASGWTDSLEDVGGGWWRLVMTGPWPAGATTQPLINLYQSGGVGSYAGTAGYGVLIYGCQSEHGDTVSPYIACVASSTASTFSMQVRKADGTISYSLVTPANHGVCSEFTLATPGSPVPAVGDLYVVGYAGIESAPMIVKAIAPGPDLAAVITMVPGQSGVWTADQGTIPPFQTYISNPYPVQRREPPAVAFELLSDSTTATLLNDGTTIERIKVLLAALPVGDNVIAAVEAEWKNHESISYQPLFKGLRADGTVWIDGVIAGNLYDVQARALTKEGYPGPWTQHSVRCQGKSLAPGAITGFSITAVTGGAQLQWQLPLDGDLWHTAIIGADTNSIAYASKTMTFTGNPSNNDTVTVNGVVFTALTSGGDGISSFTIASGASNNAEALLQCLQASRDTAVMAATYSRASGVITVTATLPGTEGNLFTLAESMANFTVGGALLTGGVGFLVNRVADPQHTYVDPLAAGQARYYWLAAVDLSGNVGALTAGLTAGTSGGAVRTSPLVFTSTTDPVGSNTVIEGDTWIEPGGNIYTRQGVAWIVTGTAPAGGGGDGDASFSSTTPGAWTYTILAGAQGFVTVTLHGGNGGASDIFENSGGPYLGGQGGTSVKHFAVTPGDVLSGTVGGSGQSNVDVGTSGGNTTCNRTSPAVAMAANGGQYGGPSAGNGGTASGGDTNTTGTDDFAFGGVGSVTIVANAT